MADVVDRATRSAMMAGIKGRHTRPELIVRRYLHKEGFRFRLHVPDLPGRPDIVLPKWNAVIDVRGCFWHRHTGCKLTSSPSTRVDFWERKFASNVERDRLNSKLVQEAGWRLAIMWECALRADPAAALHSLTEWLTSQKPDCLIIPSGDQLLGRPPMPGSSS